MVVIFLGFLGFFASYFSSSSSNKLLKDDGFRFADPLDSYVISSSDNNGGYYKLTVIKTADGAMIDSVSRENSEKTAYHRHYDAPAEILTEIEDLFYSMSMHSWNDRAEKRTESYDMQPSEFSFTFGNENVSFNSDKIPKRSGAIASLGAIVEKFSVNENSGLVLKTVKNAENSSSEEKSVSASAVSFENGYLLAEIFNGGDENISFDPSFRLTKSGSDLFEAEAVPCGNEFIKCGTSSEIELDLNACGKLEAGKYIISFAEISFEFELFAKK